MKPKNDSIERLLNENEVDLSIAQAVFDGTEDGVLIINKDHKLLFENKALNEQLGNNIGAFCYRAYQNRSEPCIDCPAARTFKDGNVYKAEKAVTTNDGTMHVEIMSSPIKNSIGEIVAVAEIKRAITERINLEIERERLICELESALSEIKVLRGLLPICSHCKKIRNSKGYWDQVDTYISRNTDTKFSHCICPDCFKEHHSDLVAKKCSLDKSNS